MKQILTTLFLAGLLMNVVAQTQPANVCTSKLSYSYDEEITWYYDLTGNTAVSPGDDIYFYSWAPNNGQSSILLSYVSDMIWKMTWTPTDYYQTDLATLEVLGDGAFWHNLTKAGGVEVTGTVGYAIKEQLRKGSGCNCIFSATSDNKYLVNFAKSTATIDAADGAGNYWTNVTANDASYDLVTTTNGGYYQLATSGGFIPNDNSDFTAPTSGNLGELAEVNATKSYLYLQGSTGTVTLSCLEQDHKYKLSILGSRNTTSTRETKYTVTGATTSSGTIQTSGTGLGSGDCTNCNDDELYVVEATPDGNGEISILVEIVSGGFGYINAMMIEEMVPVTWSAASWSNSVGPSATSEVVLDDDYNTGTSGSLEMANLTVNAGKTLTVSAGTSLNIHGNLQNDGTILVESGASLMTYNGNMVGGNDITIKRNTRYADGKYSFVGSPVAQDASITGASLGTWVYAYDETLAYGADGLDRWTDAANSQLMAGKGYAQAGQQEISFTGTPNAGTITFAGSYTDRSDANDGWNLVANPYAAAIDYTAFMNDNTNNTGSVYIWDDNGSDAARGDNSDYIVINASGNTNSTAGNISRYNGYIGSAQAFFIKLDGQGNEDVVFEEDQRVGGNNADENFFRMTAEKQRLRVNLTNQDGLFKQTLIAWNEEVNDATINRMYDAALFNTSAEYAIYSKKLDQALAIQTLTSAVSSIPLGINVGAAGSYTLQFDASEFDGDLFLIDHQLNKTIDIRNGAYTFSANPISINGRFELVKAQSILSRELTTDWKIFANGQTIYIQPLSGKASEFKIFSISGQFVTGLEVKQSVQVQLNENPGIYIVTNGLYSQKVILK